MTEVNDGTDPFDAHNLAVGQFIMSCRIYDALMALLTSSNPSLANDLLELHTAGSIVGSQPSFNGQFITDLANDFDESEESTPDE